MGAGKVAFCLLNAAVVHRTTGLCMNSQPTPQNQTDPLRSEVIELGTLLGQVIAAVDGEEQLELVERVRQLSRNYRQGLGDQDENDRLKALLASLTYDQLRIVIRAFTVFLDLANLAEDRERVRVLRSRSAACFPDPTQESIEAAIAELKANGTDSPKLQEILDRLLLELVFTAHPTEAKRRSVRSKLRRIRGLLESRDAAANDPVVGAHVSKSLRSTLTQLWLTDFIRPWRPSVLQEVKRGLSFKPTLWKVTPAIVAEVRAAIAKEFPEDELRVSPCIQFGSWIGGDRDGHPFVTPDVTEQTLLWLHNAAVDLHLQTCNKMRRGMSISSRQVPVGADLQEEIQQSVEKWPDLEEDVSAVPPHEILRKWLSIIQWRLGQSSMHSLSDAVAEGAYETLAAFRRDVSVLHEALRSCQLDTDLGAETSTWLDQIDVFGFHLARLDVRQDSRTYRNVVDELLKIGNLSDAPETISEEARQTVLTESLGSPVNWQQASISDVAKETLELFRLLRVTAERMGYEALGAHVISMTNQPSDVLTVQWLWNQVGDVGDASSQPVPIVPLFETIEDLQNGPDIMRSLLQTPAYRNLLKQQSDRQFIMLGYSDSTKDGGYLSASWSLYECQFALQQLADAEGIEIVFFHGRGGSLGRGGGPAARSILSLPRRAFHGSLRLTEQGEVLADRYDDPKIAKRHFEQLIWSSLLAAGTTDSPAPQEWIDAMRTISDASFSAYRALVEKPGFVEFFRRATPISEVEQMPIGSRPARRKGGSSLSDLRAIPWVFSWTQSRLLLPAWFGIGQAFSDAVADPQEVTRLRKMYREWPFFRATIDNAELALAKVDLGIAKRYAGLFDSPQCKPIWGTLETEYALARNAILQIVDREELLGSIPWLKESIQVRNWYIDPLNFVQVELLGRMFATADGEPRPEGSHEEDELRHLLRLTVNGIAAGLRTTG